jgi:signal transduction histidine kinase
VSSTSRVRPRLRAIGEINQALLDGTPLEVVFERLAARARTLLDADSVLIGTLEADGSTVRLRAVVGAQAARLQVGMLRPLDETLLASAVRSGRATVAFDMDPPAHLARDAQRLGIGGVITVPLALRGQIFGAIGVARRVDQLTFEPPDLDLLATFAAQAAIALEYGRARDELRRLAVLAERERIARELHEGVIQSLFGVGLELQALAAAAAQPAAASRLVRIVDGLDQVIRDLRNYVFGLRPGDLADRQLADALADLGSEWQARTGLPLQLEIDGALAARLGGAAAGDILQITREALSNVARHAGATTCRLRLCREHSQAVLEIADDGRGLPAATGTTGHGLPNMRARAAALGCVLAFGEGLHGRGTSVRLTLEA